MSRIFIIFTFTFMSSYTPVVVCWMSVKVMIFEIRVTCFYSKQYAMWVHDCFFSSNESLKNVHFKTQSLKFSSTLSLLHNQYINASLSHFSHNSTEALQHWFTHCWVGLVGEAGHVQSQISLKLRSHFARAPLFQLDLPTIFLSNCNLK